MNAKRIMWTCRRTAFAFIRLCGICSANKQMLSVWSRYFTEKYVRHRTDVNVYSFGQPTNNQRNAFSFACGGMLNKQLFGIRWHSPRSCMLCSRLHTDVDAPLYEWRLVPTDLDNWSSTVPVFRHTIQRQQ